MVWTSNTLYIASGEALIDTVPLHEILAVTEMKDDTGMTSRTPNTILKSGRESLDLVRFFNPSLKSDSSEVTQSRISMEGDMHKRKLSKVGHKTTTMQIKTIPDGFNLGKTYYIRPSTNGSNEFIISSLLSVVKSAKKRFHRRSMIAKSQDMMKAAQGSFPFQMLMALLIMTVCVGFAYPDPYLLTDIWNHRTWAELCGQRSRGAAHQLPVYKQRGTVRPWLPSRAAGHVLHHRLHSRARHQPLRQLDPPLPERRLEQLRFRRRFPVAHRAGPRGHAHQRAALPPRLPRRAPLWPHGRAARHRIVADGRRRARPQRLPHIAHRFLDM